MIITVANQKGGVGKTDLAVNLSSYLAKMGKKVLVVDMDPQANATDYILPVKPKLTSGDLLLREDLKLHKVAVETPINNLSLVAANPSLSAAQIELLNDVGMQFKLKRKLSPRGSYDYIFIDTPPSLGMLTINALAASDAVIIPIQVHYFAMEGVGKLMNTIEMVKREINPELDILGYVLTMYDKRNLLSSRVEKNVRESFKKKVFNTVIPINVDLADAPSKHMPIMLHAKDSRGAFAYARLAKEFLNSR
jgi:chromosome partitioning protein